jgi:hypothetical protein
MARVRSVPGGRAVEVDPERLTGWFDRFAAGHGGTIRTTRTADVVVVTASDGASASVEVPFGPLTEVGESSGLDVAALVDHLLVARRVGIVLVRLGGHSVGIARNGRVVVSSTDRRPVHGRNKAGGWSQRRFARRREGQARVALTAAADAVARVLVPELGSLDAVVLGGDRTALDTLATDRRLAGVFAIAQPRVLDVPEPRRTVLDEAAARARSVEVVVHDGPRT